MQRILQRLHLREVLLCWLLEHAALLVLLLGLEHILDQLLLVLVIHFCWPLKAQSQAVGVFVAVLGHTALHSPLQ